MGLINNTVTLENNYQEWKTLFNEEKEKLQDVFKKDVITIEHVGSTSIENLKSKPIVDIAIGVNDSFDIDDYKDLLKEIYTIKEDNNEILLIKENSKETFFLIHILNINSERYTNMIKFKEVLINNPSIKEEYESLKISLANKYPNNRKEYTKSKNDFINKVLNMNEKEV